MLLCVGEFPRFQSSALIVEAQRVVDLCVKSVVNGSHSLGILIPVPEQEAWVRKTFSIITSNLAITALSPYSSYNNIAKACESFTDLNCNLIVLYCMGYTHRLAREIRDCTGTDYNVAATACKWDTNWESGIRNSELRQ